MQFMWIPFFHMNPTIDVQPKNAFVKEDMLQNYRNIRKKVTLVAEIE